MHLILTIILVISLLAGCEEPEPVSSLAWEVPQLNYGVLEYEKLSVLPWYSGRTEATSFNTFAESKTGFYTNWGNSWFLRYAEKTDLKNWVRVCNNPSCPHIRARCGSRIDGGTFSIHDGKIYTIISPSTISDYVPKNSLFQIFSSNLDGTDRMSVMEAPWPDSSATAISLGVDMTKDGILFNLTVMNPDGTFTHYLHLTNENGTFLVRKVDLGEDRSTRIGQFSLRKVFGDTVLEEGYSLFDELLGHYRIAGDSIEKLEITHLPCNGMYVSGNTARFFRQNDGYYDYDLTTGQEVKVADAQLTDSGANIVLPNCIIETTMLTSLTLETIYAKEFEQGPPHQLVLFDGERWRDVKLPEHLVNADMGQFMHVDAITSEFILIRTSNLLGDGMGHYYKIDLNEEELWLEWLFDRREDPYS